MCLLWPALPVDPLVVLLVLVVVLVLVIDLLLLGDNGIEDEHEHKDEDEEFVRAEAVESWRVAAARGHRGATLWFCSEDVFQDDFFGLPEQRHGHGEWEQNQQHHEPELDPLTFRHVEHRLE